MIHFLTYSDHNYKEKQLALVESAKSHFNCIVKDRGSLEITDFYKQNKFVLDMLRGAGYWLWKPFFIYSCLCEIPDNDIVFYLDSGDSFKPSLLEDLEKIMIDRDYIFTPGVFLQKCFTKGDCFYLMGCEDDYYKNRPQLEAGIIVVRKTDAMLAFTREWLRFCQNPQILTDLPNLFSLNDPKFIDHRHDQSILTNLVQKYHLNTSEIMRDYVKCNV